MPPTDTTPRPELRDEILEDLAEIALRDPKWALARAYEYGHSHGKYVGTMETLDRLVPKRSSEIPA